MIQFELPEATEDELRKSLGDLSEAAREAFLIRIYHDGLVSLGKVAELRGKGVLETQEWLAQHGVPLQYSLDDLAADSKTAAELFPDSAS